MSSHQAQRMPHGHISHHYHHLTDLDMGLIVELHEAGWSYCAVDPHVGHTDIKVAQCFGPHIVLMGT